MNELAETKGSDLCYSAKQRPNSNDLNTEYRVYDAAQCWVQGKKTYLSGNCVSYFLIDDT